MKLIFIPIVFFLIIGMFSSIRGQFTYDKYSDDELYQRLSATCSDDVDLAAAEFLKRGEKGITFLLSKKGDKRLFLGEFYLKHPNKSQRFLTPTNDMEYNKRLLKNGDLRSMEVAALFLINAIFLESLNISQTPDLRYETSEGYPKVGNKPKLIKKAWKAVDKWAIRLKAEGLAELQRKEITPLDLERDGVDFY